MRSLISFFTRIPMKGEMESASSTIYLLTVVALIIAAIPVIIFVIFNKILPKVLISLILLVSIYSVTGLLHLDGLADFSDGVMKKGNREEKIRALKDVNTGIGGTFSVIIILLSEFLALNYIKFNLFDISALFFISEVSSKLSMISGLTFFKAPDEGLAHLFKLGIKRYFIIIAIILTTPLLLIYGILYLSIFAGIIVSFITGFISIRDFGFVNGDALGAMNEISRAVTMWLVCLVL